VKRRKGKRKGPTLKLTMRSGSVIELPYDDSKYQGSEMTSVYVDELRSYTIWECPVCGVLTGGIAELSAHYAQCGQERRPQ
jgi:hypothetical protein